MKWNIVLAVTCAALVAGCASKRTRKATGTGEKVSGLILIHEVAPYESGAAADNVVSECTQLGAKLSNFTSTYGLKRGIRIEKTEKLTKKTKGNVLLVSITSVHSGGNASLGHSKSATVKAELYKDGVLVDSVTRSRASRGGPGALFKGSCSVLGRTMKALGADVAKWVKTYSI